MRLLASTDFALRVLLCLGAEPGEIRSTEALATEIGVPRNHVHKLVQALAALGLVRTVRGARGGVQLGRPAERISIGGVVRQLEAGQALVECFREDGGACRLMPGCRLRNALARARDAFLTTLDAVTLADCLGDAAVLNPAGAASVHRASRPR
uniref:RrF2 family transcriptional regulator n=1 Tax=Elioraea rosea TaxID=2492390 RepID=UPI001183EF33|nr:Rrf2 family transcriptional regulator [Elioraea rosea]